MNPFLHENDPHTRIRRTVVPGEGVFDVPTHISRVDSGKPAPSGWHGWQVRWPGHRQFFTDAAFGSCAAALAEAINYRARHYAGKRTQIDPNAGVSIVRVRPARGRIDHLYAVASSPARGASPKKVYIGTENTVTLAKIKAATKKARALRSQLVDEHIEREQLLR